MQYAIARRPIVWTITIAHQRPMIVWRAIKQLSIILPKKTRTLDTEPVQREDRGVWNTHQLSGLESGSIGFKSQLTCAATQNFYTVGTIITVARHDQP